MDLKLPIRCALVVGDRSRADVRQSMSAMAVVAVTTGCVMALTACTPPATMLELAAAMMSSSR